jgi:mono/diheme cytochrome c family protein
MKMIPRFRTALRVVSWLATACLLLSLRLPVSHLPQGGVQASVLRGKKVYGDQCLSCHQVDGGGVQGMNPPLIKTKWVLGDKPTLIRLVLNGMTTAVEINGDSYHNVMAPHKDLTDLQIADVLTYIRNSFGNKAKSVSQQEVKLIRAQTK